MQQIERTRILGEELQNLIETSMIEQGYAVADESAVSEALHSIFLTKRGRNLHENKRPGAEIYLQVLECPPDQREKIIAAASDESVRRDMEIAHGDLIRFTGSEDYSVEGDADPFDFSWAIPLVRQKASKGGDETGGVKVRRLRYRQQLLELCLRIRPALSLDQANHFLMHIMRDMPIRYRSPIDAAYYFALYSGGKLGGLDDQRAFVREMLDQMAQHYRTAAKNESTDQSDEARLTKERREAEKQRLKEENAALKAQEKQEAELLKKQKEKGLADYQSGRISRAEWIALQDRVSSRLDEIKQNAQQRRTLRQLQQQQEAEARARQRMAETYTIFQQFADIEPGDREEFAFRYAEELPQMDLLDNHYAARRHLRENIEALGMLSDNVIVGKRKTVKKMSSTACASPARNLPPPTSWRTCCCPHGAPSATIFCSAAAAFCRRNFRIAKS